MQWNKEFGKSTLPFGAILKNMAGTGILVILDIVYSKSFISFTYLVALKRAGFY